MFAARPFCGGWLRIMTGSKEGYERDIYSTGEYKQHFTPDDRRNPFWKIYQRKKQDTIHIIHSLGLDAPPGRILDVGGGVGRLSLQLAQSESGIIVLSDINTDMLTLAAKSKDSAGIRGVTADAQYLPFQSSSFDVIAALDLFCHLENPELALAEFHRVLINGGTLILDSTNSNPMWTFFYPRYLGMNPSNWLKIIRLGGILPGWEKIVRHYSKKRFIHFIHNAGFQVLKTVNYGPLACPKWHLAISKKVC
jgi:ubiquinone/menaquinone biosynthesis C-methylase UbiE